LKFCARTKGLNEEQNKEFAKNLKEFTQKEAEKFRNEESQQGQEDEE